MNTEFPRIKRLPPYVFNITGELKMAARHRGEDIIDFSEVRDFIDTPVKRYSSGMYVKLAFSVAAHLDSEIMIMDEVLAVGDFRFQEKCHRRIAQLLENGTTLLFVSHNAAQVKALCPKSLWLEHGKVMAFGNTEEVFALYENAYRS